VAGVRAIVVGAESFLDILRSLSEDAPVTWRVEGVPQDARVVGLHADHASRAFVLHLWSESWAPGWDGAAGPVYREVGLGLGLPDRVPYERLRWRRGERAPAGEGGT
jgi:hypothetical protein